MSARGSLRILNFTPWSAKDLDKNVDSPIPGKLLGGDTVNRQYLGTALFPGSLLSYQ